MHVFCFTMVIVTPSETRCHTCCPWGADMAPFYLSSPRRSPKTGRERLYYACARTARTPLEIFFGSCLRLARGCLVMS